MCTFVSELLKFFFISKFHVFYLSTLQNTVSQEVNFIPMINDGNLRYSTKPGSETPQRSEMPLKTPKKWFKMLFFNVVHCVSLL